GGGAGGGAGAEPCEGMEATRSRTGVGGPPGTGVPVSPRDRRADERAARVRSGLAELDRWLADQVRRGLTTPEVSRQETWEGVAARLVDAQAPALANRVRRTTDVVGVGHGWHERVVAEVGDLH